MKTIIVVGLFGLALVGCRARDLSQADNQLLWDKQGCAYYAQPAPGDATWLRRTPGADKPPCQQVNPFEAIYK